MQTAFRLAAGAILGGLLAVGVIALTIDAVAEAAIERDTARAFGVETDVRSVSLGFVRGSGRIRGFEASNPPGFDSERFLAVRHAHTDVTLELLRGERVPLGDFTLEGVAITLEGDAEHANYQVILESLGALEEEAGSEEKSPRSFAAREITIREVRVHVGRAPDSTEAEPRPDPEGEFAEPPAVSIERIVIRDVDGVALPALARIVVEEVLTAVVEEGGDLPATLREDLRAALERPRGERVTAGPSPVERGADLEPHPAAAAARQALLRELPDVSLPPREAPPQ
jgi:hypothetical protein